MKTEEHRLDLDFFEFVIALNCTIDEIYLSTIIDYLKFQYIENTSIRQYLEIIFDYFRKRETLPSPTEIKQYLNTDERKKAYKLVISQFKDLDQKYNQDELFQNTEQYIKERAVFHAVKGTIDEISATNNVDTGQVYARFEEACSISLVDDLGLDYIDEIDRHCQDLAQTERYISTGFNWLDKILGGGFLETGRAVYNFVGATNSGKSIFLGNIATNVLRQGYNVVIVSLEMSEMVYAKRITTNLTGIPIYELKNETIGIKQFATNFRKDNIGKLFIKEFPPNSITKNHLRAFLKKLEQRKKIKIGLIVLDYLTLMQPSISKNSMYADGKTIAEDIRALTYPQHFGCPIVTAGQNNRSGYDENPTIDATGESIGIPQTMDFQGCLWASDEDKELGRICMGIQKNRFGNNRGTHAFRINYDTLTLSEDTAVFGEDSEIDQLSSSLDRISN